MTADKIIQCHQRIFVTTAKTITIEDYFVAVRTPDNRSNTPSRFVLPTNMLHQIFPLCLFHEGMRGDGSRCRAIHYRQSCYKDLSLSVFKTTRTNLSQLFTGPAALLEAGK